MDQQDYGKAGRGVDRRMSYGLIGNVDTGWKLRPAYDLLRLFTHTDETDEQLTILVNGAIRLMAGVLRRKIPEAPEAQAVLTDIIAEAKMANAIVQEVLEFFGQEAVARVVKESPKLHEPNKGA